MHQTHKFKISEPSEVGEARRLAKMMADAAGFDEVAGGRAAIVTTELCTNLIRHGQGGELLLNSLTRGDNKGIELLALDHGPGMANVPQCLTDGYSTKGTSGAGLGAISRQASEFHVYSVPQQGTAVLARLWKHTEPDVATRYGAVCVPYPGEQVAGDAWAIKEAGDLTLAMIADGLGHGMLAATAAREATRIFTSATDLDPTNLLAEIHAALRPTRGAAAAIAAIDSRKSIVTFVGIGNISGTILTQAGQSCSMVSLSGIVGHELRRLQPFEYPWPRGSVLLLHSDGLATSWQLKRYPEILRYDPMLLAGVLLRDHTRGRDDATVLTLKDNL